MELNGGKQAQVDSALKQDFKRSNIQGNEI
jgi:hypothetical protein